MGTSFHRIGNALGRYHHGRVSIDNKLAGHPQAATGPKNRLYLTAVQLPGHGEQGCPHRGQHLCGPAVPAIYRGVHAKGKGRLLIFLFHKVLQPYGLLQRSDQHAVKACLAQQVAVRSQVPLGMGTEYLRKGQPALFSPVVAAVCNIPPLVRIKTVRIQIDHRYLTAGQHRRKLGCFFQEGGEDRLGLRGRGFGGNRPELRSYAPFTCQHPGAGELFLQLLKAGAAQLIEGLDRKE